MLSAVAGVDGAKGGWSARVWWRDRPESTRLFFFQRLIRDRFVSLLNPSSLLPPSLLLLPDLAAPPVNPPLQLLLVWVPAVLCAPGRPMESVSERAARLFGALPRPSGCAALAVHDTELSTVFGEDDDFVASAGLSSLQRVVTLFALWLGPGFEQVSIAEGGSSGRILLAVFLPVARLPSFVAVYTCLVSPSPSSGGSKKSRPTLATRVKVWT